MLTRMDKVDNLCGMRATKTDLKQRLGKLLRMAFTRPVMITDHGEVSHVLMTIEYYNEHVKEESRKENELAEVLDTPQKD